ncbi:hypothetical protein AB0M42_17730 [Streptomyces sp. NPDC051784]|uniref:hypothetical protein n=1 Tax=Streptomyces sp. NPDC051784 TaxID=3155805 RepID=UPI00341CE7BC
MTDTEELFSSDLLGRRLLGVSVEGGPTAPISRLRLHFEELGPVRFDAGDAGLSPSADPNAVTATDVARDLGLDRFTGTAVRSVREVRHREGLVDRACGLTFRFPDGEFRLLALEGKLLVTHDGAPAPGDVEALLHEDVTLAQVVRTCPASPSQWDAWTTDGQYLYLRYRHGEGSVEQHPSEDPGTWDGEGSRLLTLWDDGSGGGEISLPDFLAAAGLRLAPDAEVSVLTSWRSTGRKVWDPGAVGGASGAF